MVLFEIYQRFKSHFLNELGVSFNLFLRQKSNSSFPVANFVISNYGGIILYVREDIPSNLLATDKKNRIESFYAELNHYGKVSRWRPATISHQKYHH